jgi:hypothetical protein
VAALMTSYFSLEGVRGRGGEPKWEEEVRRHVCYCKGKQLGRAAEG